MSATKEEMQTRISLLSDEIDANEEENRFNLREIESLYAAIDELNSAALQHTKKGLET